MSTYITNEEWEALIEALDQKYPNRTTGRYSNRETAYLRRNCEGAAEAFDWCQTQLTDKPLPWNCHPPKPYTHA